VNAPEIEPAEDEEYSLSDEVYREEGSVASGEDGMLFPRTLCYRLLMITEDDDAQVRHGEDPASSQLLAEHSMGAALSEEDMTDLVQGAAMQHEKEQNLSESVKVDAHSSSAVEYANLLNAARQQPTPRQQNPGHGNLPYRANRGNTKPVPRTAAEVAITRTKRQSTGKLRRPTREVEHTSNTSGRSRVEDVYEPPRSPSKPSPVQPAQENTTPSVTPPKKKTQKPEGVENDDAPVDSPPLSRKSKRIAGEDASVEPVSGGEIVENAVRKRMEASAKRRSATLGENADQVQSPPKRLRSSKNRPAKRIEPPEQEAEPAVPRWLGRPPGSRKCTKNTNDVLPEKSSRSSRAANREEKEVEIRPPSSKEAASTTKKSNKAILAAEAEKANSLRRGTRQAASRKQAEYPTKEVQQSDDEPIDADEVETEPAPRSSSTVPEDSTSGHQEVRNPAPPNIRRNSLKTRIINDALGSDPYQPDGQEDNTESESDKDNQKSDDEDDDKADEYPGVVLDFLGEISELRKVFSFKRRKIPLQTRTGMKIRSACKEAEALFKGKEDDVDTSFGEQENALNHLRNLLETVESEDFKGTKREMVQDLHAQLFPLLGRVLESIWYCYAPESTEEPLPDRCIGIVIPFIRMVLSLYDRVQNWKEKPHPDLRIIRPVKNQIIAPLKKVLRSLENEKQERQLAIADREQQRARAVAAQRREEEADKFADECKERAALKRQWINLHLARMACEPDNNLVRRLRNRTRIVLGSDHEPKIEHDADGNPFERVDGLGAPRTSRPPAAVERVGPEWTDEERKALTYALERYSGEPIHPSTQSDRN
jgi:hypothetical protein